MNVVLILAGSTMLAGKRGVNACRWVQGVQVGLLIAVAQAKLCKAVFDSPYAEAAFDEVVAKQTADLTKFGQSIVQSRRAPEKVSLGMQLDLASEKSNTREKSTQLGNHSGSF